VTKIKSFEPPKPPVSLYLTLIIGLGFLSLTLTYPFNNDNALYAYMADLALHGKLPYTGSWDQNFPGVILIHALQILISGKSQLAFHIWDVLLQLCSIYFLYRIAAYLKDELSGILAGVLAALYYVQQGLWMAGERDTYVTLLLLIALFYAIVKQSQKRVFRIVIGILCGLAFLFRPTYGLFALPFLWWFYNPIDNRTSVTSITYYLLGCCLPLLGYFAILFVSDGFAKFWEATILFNLRVYSGQGEQFAFWEPVRFYWISAPAFLVACWYGYSSRSTERKKTIGLLLLQLIGAIISLLLLYRHSVYHYHPAMVLFLLISAIGWSRIIEYFVHNKNFSKLKASYIQGVAASLIILFFAFQAVRGNTIKNVLVDLARGKITSFSEMYSYYEGSPMFGEQVQSTVGDYLKSHIPLGENVQMFGPYSYPQYRAGLGTVSRFQTIHALVMRKSGMPLQDFQMRWRQEYLDTLKNNPPYYFIVCDAPEAFRQYYNGRLGHEILREDFTALNDWLLAHYKIDTVIGAFTLYDRRNNP